MALMFTRAVAQFSEAFRAVHQIPLWPESNVCRIATPEHYQILSRVGEGMSLELFVSTAWQAINDERLFIDRCTDAQFIAVYGKVYA